MFHLSSKKKKQTFCSIPDFIHAMKKSSDFSSYNIIEDGTLCLFYYKSTVESLIIKRFILAPIKNKLDEIQHIDDILNVVSIEDTLINPSIDDIREKLLGGYVLLQLKKGSGQAAYALLRAESTVLGTRLVNDTEN
ncbi:spore germination protein GerYA, partial [Bacillus anthracis]|nr:spore germination protein GerYA [Bacillus anthracis]